MPDFLLMTQAALLAGITAATVYLALAAPRWSPSATRTALGWTLGLGSGFFVGCWCLGLWPNWPPLGDRDRWLTVLLPATVVVECVAAGTMVPRWLVWVLHGLLAAAVTPILLYGTIYLDDVAGPGTSEWPLPQAVGIMSGLAAALLVVWALLEWLKTRTTAATVGASLFLTAAAASVAVMHSGYTTGGQMGIALAGALAGASAASFLLAGPALNERFSGVGLIGLFSVIMLGRFFGTLSNQYALVLLFAPLMPWIMELPGLRRLNFALRTGLGLILVVLPLFPLVCEGVKAALRESDPEAEYSQGP